MVRVPRDLLLVLGTGCAVGLLPVWPRGPSSQLAGVRLSQLTVMLPISALSYITVDLVDESSSFTFSRMQARTRTCSRHTQVSVGSGRLKKKYSG